MIKKLSCVASVSNRWVYVVIALTMTATSGCVDLGAPQPTGCGGANGVACGSSSFCKFDDGDCAGSASAGVCTPMPSACTQEFTPVCGCDGLTYSNACRAEAVGMNIAHRGPCEPPPDAFCGGIAGIQCENGFYCLFEGGTCGDSDQSGVCAEIPDVCIEVVQSVCGCDGTTYSNDCFAAMAGVSVAAESTCAE